MPLWIRLSVRYLFQAKKRNRLVGAAVAAATLLLVLSMGLLQGVADRVVEVSSILGGGQVHVLGYLKNRRSFGTFAIDKRDEVMALAQRLVPDAFVDDRIRGLTGLSSNNSETTCIFYYGVDIAKDRGLAEVLVPAPRHEYVDGAGAEVVGDIERLREPHSVVIFAEQARKLGVDVNDTITLRVTATQAIESAVDATVVAVVRDVPDFSNFFCYSDKETARTLLTLQPTQTTIVGLRLPSIRRIDEAAATLREGFAAANWELSIPRSTQAIFKLWDAWSESWIGQRFEIGPWSNEMWWMDWRVHASKIILIVLTAMLCLVVGLGAISATTVAVRSRTVELGTLRALGISPAQLVGMVLLETALLAVMAVGLGAAVGLVIVAAVNGAGVTLANSTARYLLFGDTLHMAVSYGHLFFVLFLMVCITVAAALYPAAQAARIGPTDAMRDTF